VTEYLEKHYDDHSNKDEAACLRLAIQSLLEVVESGSKNIEVAVMRKDGLHLLPDDEVEKMVKQLLDEKEKAEKEKKGEGR